MESDHLLCAFLHVLSSPFAGTVTIANATLGSETISIDPSLLSAPTSTHSHLGAILGGAIGGGLGGLLLFGSLVMFTRVRRRSSTLPPRPSMQMEVGSANGPVWSDATVSAFITQSQSGKAHYH